MKPTQQPQHSPPREARQPGKSPVDAGSTAELVAYVARALVSRPEVVRVTVEDCPDEGEFVIHLTVAPEDRGAVIGRQGRLIRAIEIVVDAATDGDGRRTVLEVDDSVG